MAPPSAPRVLVVGDVIADVIVRPDGPLVRGTDRQAEIELRPGGSGANTAAWLGYLGAHVRFAGRVGAADADAIAAELAVHAVDARLGADPDHQTGRIVAIVDTDGERSFFTDRGANTHLAALDLAPELLDGTTHLHVSGYSLFEPGPRAAVLELAERATERGISVSVDPSSAAFLREVGPAAFLEWTSEWSLCVANADEAAVLTSRSEPDEALGALVERYESVVMKLGADGALAQTRSGERSRHPSEATDVVDTTGAGDAAAAGFLRARLGSAPLDEALRAAMSAAAVAVATLGGRPPASGA
ncbi:MAG: hypothetical protein KDB21_12135 [Acidimicrobiales bacterium]|nr:hypothetical protein [Acidimicrobiales bacterium]